jgi:hypothetical protein
VDSSESSAAKFEFSKVECLLFAFHTIVRQDSKFITENPDLFKDFKVRISIYEKTFNISKNFTFSVDNRVGFIV